MSSLNWSQTLTDASCWDKCVDLSKSHTSSATIKPGLCSWVSTTVWLQHKSYTILTHSDFCVEVIHCSEIYRQATRGLGLCLCMVLGVIVRFLGFLPGRQQIMATEIERVFFALELNKIKKNKLQMLKRTGRHLQMNKPDEFTTLDRPRHAL